VKSQSTEVTDCIACTWTCMCEGDGDGNRNGDDEEISIHLPTKEIRWEQTTIHGDCSPVSTSTPISHLISHTCRNKEGYPRHEFRTRIIAKTPLSPSPGLSSKGYLQRPCILQCP
jgi:hypothetical protein